MYQLLRRPAILALSAVTAIGCSGGAPRTDDAATDASLPALDGAPPSGDLGGDASWPVDDAAPGGDGGAVQAPDTAAGRRLAWLLDLINGNPAAITAEAVAPHFAPSFLAAIPAPTLAALFAEDARTAAPLILVGIAASTDTRLVAVVRTARQVLRRVTLQVAAEAPHPFTALLFQPAPELDPSLGDWAVLGGRLARSAARVRALVAEVRDDGCQPVHALAAGETMPLGSAFKLYVLGALAQKVAREEASWDDLVEIQERWKSLPSGELQNLAAGTKLTVREVAAKMIAISDNTATDHLLHLVGRQAVETAQGSLGMSRPELNVPFFSTRDLFVLKLAVSAEEREQYLAAAPAERRRRLDEVYARTPLPDLAEVVGSWTAPRHVEELEWFASPEDLCRAYLALRRLAAAPTGSPLLGILAANPGAPPDPRTFRYMGFKGGSEPGVLVGSWLLQRTADNRWFVVAVGSADPVKVIDEEVVFYLALAAIQLTGKLP